ncbi:MAG: GreA/GreB family elongation factor [Candidatus Saccharibacteria bacterium]
MEMCPEMNNQTPEVFESDEIRNGRIQNLIKNGTTPMLPFEYIRITDRLFELGIDQPTLDGLINKTMANKLSEEWDNKISSRLISDETTSEVKKLISVLNTSKIINYPSTRNQQITVGSLASIKFDDSDEESLYLITGSMNETYKTNATELEIEAARVTSPLGESLFRGRVGDIVKYYVNGSPIKVEIMQIEQVAENDVY